jgi:hypothetical protein
MPQLKDLSATADVPQLNDSEFHRKGKKVGDIRKVWTSSYRAVGIQPRAKIRKGKKIAGPGARVVATLCQGRVRSQLDLACERGR